MLFPVPKELVEFEYLGSDEIDKDYDELAKDYSKEIDFAFFVVNFGYTKSDYEQLTLTEKLFIYKAYENKMIGDNTLLRNAVLNATVNANRKKGKKFIELFKKKSKKLDREKIEQDINIVKEVEEKEGNYWIEKLYIANGMEYSRKGVG